MVCTCLIIHVLFPILSLLLCLAVLSCFYSFIPPFFWIKKMRTTTSNVIMRTKLLRYFFFPKAYNTRDRMKCNHTFRSRKKIGCGVMSASSCLFSLRISTYTFIIYYLHLFVKYFFTVFHVFLIKSLICLHLHRQIVTGLPVKSLCISMQSLDFF